MFQHLSLLHRLSSILFNCSILKDYRRIIVFLTSLSSDSATIITPSGSFSERLTFPRSISMIHSVRHLGHSRTATVTIVLSNILPHIGHTILYCRLGLTFLLYTSCLQSSPYLRIRELKPQMSHISSDLLKLLLPLPEF